MDSIWTQTAAHHPRPPLRGDLSTDVLIIGGGMCGILTAHMLKTAGIHTVVAEAKTVGGGVTGRTTAKITAQHGLCYADFVKRFGTERARLYYDANMTAAARYRTLAAEFPCDLEDQTAHIYSADNRRALEREADAYVKLGISAPIIDAPPLPITTVGALAMEKQAQFHPLKLLYALAAGLEVCEDTFVRKIEDGTAYTAHGKIRAKHIVLATHYPLVNIPGLYFLKLYQHRSYVTVLEGAPPLEGMYLDERENGLSFRGCGDLLFVGGGDHRSGKQGGGYASLTAFTKQAYPKAVSKYRWATQDCMSLDQMPYIGRHRRGTSGLYAASGFNKWGMTGSMAAAETLTGLIVHGTHEWAELFSPRRSVLSKQLFVNLGAATAGLLSAGGPRCAHMGCKLHRNIPENSWDCACHGSRFDADGTLITGPAKKGIKP